ncbi:hypothetical protein HK405_012377, partial [Cladochytrium tenue]
IVAGILTKWGRTGLGEYAQRLQEQYTTRRDAMMEAFFEALGPIPAGTQPPAEFVTPRAGMFVWLKVNLPASAPASTTMKLLHARLVERSVLVIPGELFLAARQAARSERLLAAFAAGERFPDATAPEVEAVPYFRLSFSFASLALMKEAMGVLAEVLREFGCGGEAVEVAAQ